VLDRAGRRLTRAVRVAEQSPAGDGRDAAFHEARKRAKQLRYAAEPAVALFGSRARRLVRSAQGIQNVLGERQDAVIARALLRDFRLEADLDAGTLTALDALDALEERELVRHEAAFLQLWKQKGFVSTLRA
jgi:CHAD domain-containing protein